MSAVKRFYIANLAMGQAMIGGHYLKGARGAFPGAGAVVGRSVDLKEDSVWDTLRVHTGANSLQTCYGRWSKAGGYLFQVGSTQLSNLKKYVADNKGKPMSSWPHFEKPNMFPRRLKGSDSAIALGEDCRNKRHFDCIGFIYWVLHEAAPSVGWENFGIESYAKNGTYWDFLGQISASDLKYGDIVTRLTSSPKHIGVISIGNKVVHAAMESKGVVSESYSSSSWHGVTRIKDAYL